MRSMVKTTRSIDTPTMATVCTSIDLRAARGSVASWANFESRTLKTEASVAASVTAAAAVVVAIFVCCGGYGNILNLFFYKAFRQVETLFVQGRNLVPSRPAISQ